MTIDVVRMTGNRPFPPRMTDTTSRFWMALQRGEFLMTQCAHCCRVSFPPKQFCPNCWSRDITWRHASGRGRLYSHTMIHFTPALFRAEAPLRVSIVDLEEGVRVAVRLLCDGPPRLDEEIVLVALEYDDGFLFGARQPAVTHGHVAVDETVIHVV